MKHRLAWLLVAPLAVAFALVGQAARNQDDAKKPDDPTKLTPAPLLLQRPSLSKTHIAFSYGDDLWLVARDGGQARQLTTNPGVEWGPVFSPDGKHLAFTGTYDGNEDVYVVSVSGGAPRRLTYHPGSDHAIGWTNDGARVVFRSARDAASRYTRLFTMSPNGGLPEELPLPMADHGSYSPDGKKMAYVPFVNTGGAPGRNVAWKQYKGGRQPFIWVANLDDSSAEKLPRERSQDFCPMWVGSTIYFLSDREGRTTLFAYETEGKTVKKLIDKPDYDLKWASANGDSIVFEKPGGLFLYDIKSGSVKQVPITIDADLASLRTRFVKVEDNIAKAGLSPSGARAVFEARGDVFTVPASKGDPRNLTATSGAAERDPAWSPDGKTIAYFSDASGEYQLHLAPQDGNGEVKKVKLPAPSFYYHPTWSPDGKKIAYTDKKCNLWYVDLASEKHTKVDTSPYDNRIAPPSWSPDSKWLTYTRPLTNHFGAVFLYSLATGKPAQVSDGMSDASSAVFDKGGKYLYFTASTDSGPLRGMSMSALNRPTTDAVYLVVLNAEEPSPLAPESDEEKGEPDKKEKKDKKDAPNPNQAPTVKVDLDDLDQRILALPVPARNYHGLAVSKPGVLWLLEGPAVLRPTRMTGPPAITLHRFELGKRKAEKWLEGVTGGGVAISHNGEKMLVRTGVGPAARWSILQTTTPPKPGEGALNLSGMEVRLDPAAEWKQMYDEVWRLQRDFLYDPGFHGLDIQAARKKYEPFLKGVASRMDLRYLMEEMLGDLALGHVYIMGGDQPRVRGAGTGLLGCDFEVANGRYRIKKVYRGENWSPELRAPLTQPGARVKAGEYVLAIGGVELKGRDNVYQFLEGKANKQVRLKVGPNADGSDSREVTVVPVASEMDLRHYNWVTENREKVSKATGGKVAYIYLPNTAGAGHERFVREFYAQVGKDGVIIDERFNGGGQLADQVIDALNQRPRNYIATREGADQVMPRGIFGPKVMLINEAAGSGGDYLPYAFRQANLGKLVGKRTWGGLVGIGGYPPLIDGGMVTAPHLALWFPNGRWDVENIGVEPDVEVEYDPKAAREGKDPQLDKAIEIVLDELKKNPVKRPSRPAYPNYHKVDKTGGK